MAEDKEKIYIWGKLAWNYFEYYENNGLETVAIARCPRCRCKIIKSKEKYSIGEYKYCCINCDFQITLNKSIEDKSADFINIVESQRFKNAEVINIDGELIRIRREEETDSDYWVDAKLSKNRKGEIQLMVLAGSKKAKDKAQLFLEPKNEKMTFDQNNDHPNEVFSKVVATFKKSKSKFISKNKKL